MTHEEYVDLFHKAQVNLVAFKMVFHCDDELRKMVEMAVAEEREACAKLCEDKCTGQGLPFVMAAAGCAEAIRAMGDK